MYMLRNISFNSTIFYFFYLLIKGSIATMLIFNKQIYFSITLESEKVTIRQKSTGPYAILGTT